MSRAHPTSSNLRIAVPRGAMFADSLDLLELAGIPVDAVRQNDRKLFFADEGLITMRPSDVVTYVHHGSADLGITGKDVIREQSIPDVYELLDLKFALCEMVVAKPKGIDLEAIVSKLGRLKIATKYPRIAEQYFSERKIRIETIEVKGSVELAALTDMADAIVDLTATGATLRENGLEIDDEPLFKSTARLITNPVSYRLKREEIMRLMDIIDSKVKES